MRLPSVALAIVVAGLLSASPAQAQIPGVPPIVPGAPTLPIPPLNLPLLTPSGEFERLTLAMGPSEVGEPMAIAVLPNGGVLHTSRDGRLFYTTKEGQTNVAAQIPVYNHDEDGLQAVAVDPSFAENGWIYLYYAPKLNTPSDDSSTENVNEGDAPTGGNDPRYDGVQHLSRFTLEGTTVDLDSEKVILKVPASRGICCHVGGDIAFDAQGNLLLTTGDDTNPFESDGFTPIDERPNRNKAFDAQRTAGNTNDLRGKLLRIRVKADGTYEIPEGNLFGPGGKFPDVDPTKVKREIYAMGLRNPFRMSVDQATGAVYLGEYGPDSPLRSDNRGPGGLVEFNQIKEPGNYGWPYCVGPATPDFAYADYDFGTQQSRGRFDCAKPVNESPNNTGLRELPPAEPAWIWYDGATVHYDGKATDEFGSGGEGPMAGPVYDYDPALESDVKFPQSLEDDLFVAEYTRRWIKAIDIDATGRPTAIKPFFDSAAFAAPMDLAFGPDGSLYVLDYGSGGYFSQSEDAAVYKVNTSSGERSPIARSSASRDNGRAPFKVRFSSKGSSDPDGEQVSYAWDFDGNGTVDSTKPDPKFVYRKNGTFKAQLTVTDPSGKSGQSTEEITAGNTRPKVRLRFPRDGVVFDYGDRVRFRVVVKDREEKKIDCRNVEVQSVLGHNEHAHGDKSTSGCVGSIKIPAAWESEEQFSYYGVFASYKDRKRAKRASRLTGTARAVLQTRTRQAEHFEVSEGVDTEEVPVPEGGGGKAVTQISDGDWIGYETVNLRDTRGLAIRVAPNLGGTIEARRNEPGGRLVGSVKIPAAAEPGVGRWRTIALPIGKAFGPRRLVFVFKNPSVPPSTRPGNPDSMFSLDRFTFVDRP